MYSQMFTLLALGALVSPGVALAGGDDSPTESVSFSFATVKVQYGSTSAPAYEIVVDGPYAEDTVFRLYDGDRLVAEIPSDDGVSPFAIDTMTEDVEVSLDPHKGEIEINSWSMGSARVNGRTVTFDSIATTIPMPEGHEFGHSFGLYHQTTSEAGLNLPPAGQGKLVKIDFCKSDAGALSSVGGAR